MSFKDTLLNILKGAAEAAEEQGIEIVLQELHDSDPAEWEIACSGGLIFSQKVQNKTNSGFLKALMQGVIDAINDNRAANGPSTADAPGSNPPPHN